MKLLATIIILAGFVTMAYAQENPADTVLHTFGGKAAEAMYNNLPGYGMANGPIRLCGSPLYKQEVSEDGLQHTVCSELRTGVAHGCGPVETTYSCTLTISTNGQKLQAFPIGIAL